MDSVLELLRRNIKFELGVYRISKDICMAYILENSRIKGCHLEGKEISLLYSFLDYYDSLIGLPYILSRSDIQKNLEHIRDAEKKLRKLRTIKEYICRNPKLKKVFPKMLSTSIPRKRIKSAKRDLENLIRYS